MGATLAKVAERAGVSLATASRVLNGSAHNVTAALRARVLAAARELSYVPNAQAQALAGSSSPFVGVLVHDMSDPYFSEILRGIQLVATEASRLVTICNTYRHLERELEYVRLLHAQRVEALIMAGSGLDARTYSQAMAAQIDLFTAAGGRAIFIGRHQIAGDSVLPDNFGGARALGRLLAELGHRKIGVINGPPLVSATRDRLEGFRSGLLEGGVTLGPDQIVEGDFSRDSGLQAASLLLERLPDLSAIFALNDVMAVGALAALRARAIPVPAQISVVGFDDIPLALDVTPALTTVRVPMQTLGARAMALALEPAGAALRVEHLATELIVRASSGPAPTTG